VRVAVARPLAGEWTYATAAHQEVRVGVPVLVPFGPHGETGFVTALLAEPDLDPSRVKTILRVLDPVPAFDATQLAFYRWIADYYLCPLGMVIATATPSEVQARVVRVYEPTEAGAAALAAGEVADGPAAVLREVLSRPGLTRRGLAQRVRDELDGDDAERALDTLVRRGWVAAGEREVAESKGKIRTVALTAPDALARVPRNAARMRAIAAELAAAPADVADLLARHGASARSAVDRLAELGVVVLGEREARDALAAAPALGPTGPLALNADQRAALDALNAPDAAGTYLLHGVTGAGKTEVFLGAAAAVVARGGQVVVLVPEIGLTPQLVGRFRARFGDAVAVLHSGLTGSERLGQWRRIRAGEATIAVGARSALFAPFRSLQLIVVDEEHDDSYKQSEGVPYHARDLAVVLGRMRRAVVVLASATPSLESWSNAGAARYQLLSLPRRATPRPVPIVERIDMSALRVRGQPAPLLAPATEAALRETFDRGGQAIVLYNRRGYATLVECGACGAAYACPSCGLSMTLHRGAWRLVCHYCGYTVPYADTCPVCHAPELSEQGRGTERVEAQLAALFPDVPLSRMDADTTAARGAHQHLLDDFRAGRTRLLVGTQIVAKGHDFPGVQTAVVISADRGLQLPDFRAAERTFALIVQLAGRAGRGDTPGRVIVQTWKPDHYALRHLDDVPGFLEAESRLRRQLRYPPHSRLCLVRLEAVERSAASAAAGGLAAALRGLAAQWPGVEVLGPAPAALPRLVGRWRFQLVLRGTDPRPWRAYLQAAHPLLAAAARKGVRLSWDVDPRHLL